MHSTAECGGASRRRRVSRGKRESRHEEENELEEKVGKERREMCVCVYGMEGEWQQVKEEDEGEDLWREVARDR